MQLPSLKSNSILTPTTGLKGRFWLEKKRNGIITWQSEFDNFITDFGLNWLGGRQLDAGIPGSNNDWGYCCCLGTGTSLPNETQDALEAYVAHTLSRTLDDSAEATPPYKSSLVRSYEFAPGDFGANPVTLYEIGIGPATDGVFLFARQRIKDSGNNLIPLTVLPEETLTVYYELQSYPDITDKVSVITVGTPTGNLDVTVTVRPRRVGSSVWFIANSFMQLFANSNGTSSEPYAVGESSFSLNDVTQDPSGTNRTGSYTRENQADYVSNSFQIKGKAIFNQNQGNFTDEFVRGLSWTTRWGGYQASFVPFIPKRTVDQLEISIIESWQRYIP
jgi:hypothetical protein